MTARPVVFAVPLVAALGVWLIQDRTTTLAPGTPAFERLVGGANARGVVPARGRAVVTLPGLRRGGPGQARIELTRGAAAASEGASLRFRVAVDAGAPYEVRTDRDGVAVVALPAASTPGARLYLLPAEGEPLGVSRLSFAAPPPPIWPVVAALLFTLAVGLASGSAALPLAGASFAMLAAVSALSWLSLPSPEALLRVAPIVLTFGASLALGRGDRRYWAATGFLAALVFGTWVRFYFVASAGSWDTEYWKAWMTRAVTHGVTRVYGEPDATPRGELLPHLLGEAELFQPEYKGRSFVVDYPPLAMALWRSSFEVVDRFFPGLDPGEKENVAVKLPAVLGDVFALVLLLLLLPGRPAAAAAYWALPLSWLPSAVLGFFDAAYAPLAVLGVVAASRGRGYWAGCLIALAALIKPQALIMAPVAAVVLWPERRRLWQAVLSGLGTVALALVPFAAAGTLDEAVTHVFRIIFQERLSAGFANPWWIVGHLANGGGWADPVQYARIDALAFPAGALGVGCFLALMLVFCRRLQLHRYGEEPDASRVCFAAGSVLFAYGLLAMGVHENHPHAMFLAFAASGLLAARKRLELALVTVLGASYVLNMLSLSVLGRFYGLRYLAVESLAGRLSGLRMALGFDLTLALAVSNTILMLVFLAEAIRGPRVSVR